MKPIDALAYALLFACAVLLCRCAPVTYAKALDKCAFDNAGDHAATVSCQCNVSQQYGRDCGWLSTRDGGAE